VSHASTIAVMAGLEDCDFDLVRAQGSARDKLGINSDNFTYTCGSCTAAIRENAIASMGVSVSGACCAMLNKGFMSS